MTTRRFRRPARRAAPRPQWSLSVSHCSVRFQFGDEILRNSDGPPQRAREGASIRGPFEAREPPVNVRSAARRALPPVQPKRPVPVRRSAPTRAAELCARSRRTSSLARSFSRGRLLMLLGLRFGCSSSVAAGPRPRTLPLVPPSPSTATSASAPVSTASIASPSTARSLRLLGLGLGGLDDLAETSSPAASRSAISR
jgi:hypothetical protein